MRAKKRGADAPVGQWQRYEDDAGRRCDPLLLRLAAIHVGIARREFKGLKQHVIGMNKQVSATLLCAEFLKVAPRFGKARFSAIQPFAAAITA